MIPGGVSQSQDFFFHPITFWIKSFHFFDCIVHFGFIIIIKAHLNNKNKMNALLYCHGPPAIEVLYITPTNTYNTTSLKCLIFPRNQIRSVQKRDFSEGSYKQTQQILNLETKDQLKFAIPEGQLSLLLNSPTFPKVPSPRTLTSVQFNKFSTL